MSQPMRIALAGLGTVGAGVVRLIEANRALIERRAGRPVAITAVSARNRDRDRGVDLSRYGWEDDPQALARRDDVDIVVEMIGGSDGPALALAEATLAARKPFVTANKAMIAKHGLALAGRAETAGVGLKFEAAVAGGIPVIKALREGAAANEISRVYGILNGTCNYILTTMERDGRDFADVLAEAQAKGFAEADPAFDIDGVDAAHKLSILASLAFGTRLDFDSVAIGGIRDVIAADIREAESMGYRVRLVGMAESSAGNGPAGLFQRVHPCLVPANHPLAHVAGSLNAVVAEGNYVGRLFFEGAGAGDGPTASAVVADIIDVARDEWGPAFSMPVGSLTQLARADAGSRVSRAYLRFTVADRPGVLAEIATAMRDADVSIERLMQRGVTAEGAAIIALVTHHCAEARIADALARLHGSASLTGAPMLMHLLDL